jgi:hypothetical protein
LPFGVHTLDRRRGQPATEFTKPIQVRHRQMATIAPMHRLVGAEEPMKRRGERRSVMGTTSRFFRGDTGEDV